MVTHILGLRLGTPILLSTPTRRRVLWSCSKLQAASAALLSVFAVIHLSSPLVGLLHFGGDVNDRVDAVSRWMLLGRVAYQSSVGEAVLWGSIAAHLVSGVVGRLVKTFTRPAKHDTAAAEAPPETRTGSTLNTAHIAGYALTPVVLHHIYVNRLLPSSSHAAIAQLSPSELDYSFVSFSLSHPNTAVRVLTAATYVALVGAFATHVVYAFPAMQRALRAKPGKSSANSKAWAAGSIAALLLSSVAAITPLNSQTRLAISGLVHDRYTAVLRMAFPSRFLF